MNSQVFTKEFEIECSPQQRTGQAIADQIDSLALPGVPIPLILTSLNDQTLTFECSFIDRECRDRSSTSSDSLRQQLDGSSRLTTRVMKQNCTGNDTETTIRSQPHFSGLKSCR